MEAMRVREVTGEEIGFFQANGWALLPQLVDQLRVAHLRHKGAQRLRSRQRTHASLVDDAFGQDRDIASHDTAFGELAHASGLGENAVRLLTGVRQVRLQVTNLLVKEAGEHGSTVFHQDFPWMPMDRSAMLTFWVALADVPADMGSLRFSSGSHRYGTLGRSFVRSGDDALSVHPWLSALPLSPPLDLVAGDATVHSSLVVHGAPANLRDTPRLSFTATYFDAETLYTGAAYGQTDGLGLTVNRPFDHPAFPVVS